MLACLDGFAAADGANVASGGRVRDVALPGSVTKLICACRARKSIWLCGAAVAPCTDALR